MKTSLSFVLLCHLAYLCIDLISANDIQPSGGKQFIVELNHPMTWYNAYLACRAKEGRLATIETAEDNEQVKAAINKTPEVYLGDSNKYFFLGGTDFIDNGFWYWMTSGKAVGGFLDWGQGEPSTACCTDKHCMVMAGGPTVWSWKAAPCNYLNYYVCEYKNE